MASASSTLRATPVIAPAELPLQQPLGLELRQLRGRIVRTLDLDLEVAPVDAAVQVRVARHAHRGAVALPDDDAGELPSAPS